VVLESRAHLIEEVGQLQREMVRQVGETETLQGLGRCAADFGVVYKTFKLELRRWHAQWRAACLDSSRGYRYFRRSGLSFGH
jgi:hypothetical protein